MEEQVKETVVEAPESPVASDNVEAGIMTPEQQLEQELAKCNQIAEVCKGLGLDVTVDGSWVIVKGNTYPVRELLGRNMKPKDPNDPNSELVQTGLGLSWKNKAKYWAYEGKLPEGYYWSKREGKIMKRGEK